MFTMAAEFLDHSIVVEGDSLMKVEQILRTDTIPDWVIEAKVSTIHCLLQWNANWRLQWIPRECNIMMHCLAHWGWNIIGFTPVGCRPRLGLSFHYKNKGKIHFSLTNY